ncbi:hypothetical protein GCM10009755_23050 [Brevibacterium samyangense]|uniref:Transmembrane protein n=1 Tax=Brevibacterium samyangense TaxID=366888 RepID=A0ABN2TIX8_9MICO
MFVGLPDHRRPVRTTTGFLVVDWILSARFRYLSWVLTTVGAGGWTVLLMLASFLPSDDPTAANSSGLFRLVLVLTFLFAVLSAIATVLLVIDRLKFPDVWRYEREQRRR